MANFLTGKLNRLENVNIFSFCVICAKSVILTWALKVIK